MERHRLLIAVIIGNALPPNWPHVVQTELNWREVATEMVHGWIIACGC